MATRLRNTGIDILGDRPWGTHFCHFYQTRQDLDDTVIPYLNAGLDDHELCQWVIAAPLSRKAKHLFEQAIPRFNHHITAGNLEILLYSQCFFENGRYNPQRVVDFWHTKLEQISKKKLAGLRVAVDGAWMEEKYWRDFSRFEKEIDPAFSGKNIMILCAYPLAHIKASAIFDVTDTHQVAIARQYGNWNMLESPELKHAKAEIDKLNKKLEQTVIERTNELAKTNEELRREIQERNTAVEFLSLLNESKSTEDLLKKAIDYISQKTGCEAVGIRLRKQHDYPYYATIGFSKKFVLLENHLCSRNEDGRINFDNNGNPVLECMCGIVISGRSDPSKPFFTALGSFWTNSTTELLAQTTETDRQARTRNRCQGEGYESVALIPLRCGDERLGVLQLNDKRKSFFSIETITMWERLSNYLSVSLSKLAAEETVQQMNTTLEQQVAERTKTAETRSKQLQSLAVELVQAEEFERQRIADLLHNDLQQLIASARMQVQLASEKIDPGPTLKNVERLLGISLEKSRRLSHDLSPPVLHQFGLTASLEWLIRHMEEQFELKVQLKTDISHNIKDEPLKVFIFRAAQELLFNSVKHSGVKHANVRLYDTDDKITLAVSDEGRGFAPEILDSFDRKAGLGLISLRERAAAIRGRLDIQSKPGQGSQFTLTVPVRLTLGDEPETPAQSAVQSPGKREEQMKTSDSHIIKILFADDHKVMRQGLIGIIADQPGIQVVGEAANGEEALLLASQLRPDVVIMDVSMPGIGGVEATRRIRAELPEVRIIGLSMFADEDIAEKMHQAGANGFVSKSESSAELLKAIYRITKKMGSRG